MLLYKKRVYHPRGVYNPSCPRPHVCRAGQGRAAPRAEPDLRPRPLRPPRPRTNRGPAGPVRTCHFATFCDRSRGRGPGRAGPRTGSAAEGAGPRQPGPRRRMVPRLRGWARRLMASRALGGPALPLANGLSIPVLGLGKCHPGALSSGPRSRLGAAPCLGPPSSPLPVLLRATRHQRVCTSCQTGCGWLGALLGAAPWHRPGPGLWSGPNSAPQCGLKGPATRSNGRWVETSWSTGTRFKALTL